MKDKFRELPFIANPTDYANGGDSSSSQGFDSLAQVSVGKSSWNKDPKGKYKKRKGAIGLTPGLGVREKDVVSKFTAELSSPAYSAYTEEEEEEEDN